MSNVNQTRIKPAPRTDQAVLLGVFDRFFTVACFYPADHSKCRSSLIELHQAMDKVVAANDALVIQPLDQGVRLQGFHLDKTHLGAPAIFNLLETLGIARFELNRDAPKEELHQMVGTLTAMKLEAESAQEFRTMDFSALPACVKIVQREFSLGSPTHKNGEFEETPVLDQQSLQAAQTLTSAEDSSALELMLDVFNESTDLTPDEPENSDEPTLQTDTTSYEISIADLTTRVIQNTAQADTTLITDTDNSGEILAVCLQMLLSGVPDTMSTKLRIRLEKHLLPPCAPQLLATLEKTITDLVQNGNRKPIDAVMPHLLPAFLKNDGEHFTSFMEQLLPVDQPEKTALVWPHLVSLMLQPKAPVSPVARNYLGSAIALLPRDLMGAEAHRLDFLTIVQNGKWGPALFQLPWQQSQGVLQALITGKQSNLVGHNLSKLWERKAPSTLVGLLVKVLGPYEGSHRVFYHGLLENKETKDYPGPMKQELSQMIAAHLMTLDAADKQDTWIVPAIEELGKLNCRESLKDLDRIQKEKRLFFFPVWPSICREAARKASSKISAQAEGGESS